MFFPFNGYAALSILFSISMLVSGLLKGKKATCYPGFDKFLEGAEYTGNMVEVVDNFILGKGPGAAPAFGFTILEKFAGAEKALEVKKGMLLA